MRERFFFERRKNDLSRPFFVREISNPNFLVWRETADFLRTNKSFLNNSFFSCKDRALERDRPYRRKKKVPNLVAGYPHGCLCSRPMPWPGQHCSEGNWPLCCLRRPRAAKPAFLGNQQTSAPLFGWVDALSWTTYVRWAPKLAATEEKNPFLFLEGCLSWICLTTFACPWLAWLLSLLLWGVAV